MLLALCSFAEAQQAKKTVLIGYLGMVRCWGAKQRLASLIPAGMQLAAAPETIVEFGLAAERILAAAQQLKPGLIVLGVRQPVGWARRLKWATAYEVVANAPCPVLTVRMTEPE